MKQKGGEKRRNLAPIRGIRISESLWKRTRHHAVELNTSASDLIRKYLIQGLQRDGSFLRARKL